MTDASPDRDRTRRPSAISKLATLARRFLPARQRRVAIAAILKNEGPYLLEWIAFHRSVGIGQFFLADNVSDDGTTELLIALDKAGIVNRLPFPTAPGQAPQLPAYDRLMKRYRRKADWIALIDCDEFLTPTGSAVSVHDLLAPIEADPTVGAVCLNWAMFGSSHLAAPTNEPVVGRFSMRAAEHDALNHVCKTLVRSKAYLQPGLNPHYVVLKKNFRAVQADGRELQLHPNGPGFSAGVVWDRMRVNHYFVKSRAEFDFIKLPRGRADLHDTRRSETDFAIHDLNHLSDPMADWLVAATRQESENIRDLLRKAGCSEELVTLDRKIAERTALLQQERREAAGEAPAH